MDLRQQRLHRGVTLTATMARELIGRRVLLRPVEVADAGRRILCVRVGRRLPLGNLREQLGAHRGLFGRR